jgi:hypothetical protein
MKPTFTDSLTTFERPMYWRMKHRDQRAFRLGDWKYLKVDENEYLFNVKNDARERANQAKLEPERLIVMRDLYIEWSNQVPAVPEDALVSLVYTLEDMPQR